MRLRRHSEKVMYEPPSVMLADLAFNLVIFFVCIASTDPESGRKQVIPRSSKDESAAAQQQNKNLEITLTRTTVAINGAPTPIDDLGNKLQEMLKDKTRTEERMVSSSVAHRDARIITGFVSPPSSSKPAANIALQVEWKPRKCRSMRLPCSPHCVGSAGPAQTPELVSTIEP